MMNLLENLNEPQLAAVTLPNQSALILAGAGSGKTRVLTTRIAWLIQTGQMSPQGVLAVTFTNKAAKEMLTRLSAMLPINVRGMWIGTFHGLCNRMLRAHHRDAGLPATFQILDSADQLGALKRMLKANNIDDERYPPRNLQQFINGAKEAGLRAKDVEVNDDYNRRFIEFYAMYDAQCNREGVVDFAELLLRCYELLDRNEILRKHYQSRFRHILVDEFQDTNKLQYAWLKQLAGSSNAIFAVGDDDQCLVRGTQILMANGSTRPIECIGVGDTVMSSFGSGDIRPSSVLRTHRRVRKAELVTVTLASGKAITSTPEHTHFAGYVLGATPQTHFVYLMYKRGVGYRLGTSQVYTRGQRKPMVGFKQRQLQEHADALWIVSTHESVSNARLQETLTSLRYGIPTFPFVARKGKSTQGVVNDPVLIARLYAEIDTASGAHRLMKALQLDPEEPHHVARSRSSSRLRVTVSLCGDRRGRRPMHRVAVFGNDDRSKSALADNGWSVRPVKVGHGGWRVETARADFGNAMAEARAIAGIVDGRIVLNGRVGARSLPFSSAAHVRPGMVMVGADGGWESVVEVRRLPARSVAVYDLDVADTHNFIASGVVTHNSIYSFRGANVGNMADFEREFRVRNRIKLEQNYRSVGHILNAANALISHNQRRLGKELWTSEGEGEPARIYEAQTDGYEAAWLVDEVRNLIAEGHTRSEIAVLYRSNAQSRIIEHALFNAAIPYRVYGGLRFFERAEIKHALAYLRLIENPADDTAFLRVVNFPPRGIGARTLEQLADAGRPDGTSLYAAVARMSGKAGTNLSAFVKLIESLRFETTGLPLTEIVDAVIQRSGLIAHFQAERDGQDRVENLNELVNAAAGFVAEEGYARDAAGAQASTEESAAQIPSPLAGFLSHASLEAGDNQAEAGQDALQLMTVHSAKGLEFFAVFITGLEEGLFPHENSLTEADGLEEERRLMYVAITRARRRLYLSLAQSRLLHGQTRYGIKSRFLEELPEAAVKWLTPRVAAGVGGGRFGQWHDAGLRPSVFDAPAAPRRQASSHGVSIGQSVRHSRFGEGVVIAIEGSGADARVQVNFGPHGVKWLMLEIAKLVPA